MKLNHSIAALILPQQTTAHMSWPSPSFFMTNTPRSHIALLLQSPFQRVMFANASTQACLHSPPADPIPLLTGAPWFLTCTTQTSPRSFSYSSVINPRTTTESSLALVYKNMKTASRSFWVQQQKLALRLCVVISHWFFFFFSPNNTTIISIYTL